MKIENRSKNRLSYKTDKHYFVGIGEVAEVEDNIAELLLKIDGVREYVEPLDVKKLEEENAKLKAKLVKQKTTKKKGTKAK